MYATPRPPRRHTPPMKAPFFMSCQEVAARIYPKRTLKNARRAIRMLIEHDEILFRQLLAKGYHPHGRFMSQEAALFLLDELT